jgi:histone-lysine N-methyltransferase SETMAR
MPLRIIEEELEISRGTIRKTLLEDFRKRKICARFVPHCLTDEQKAVGLEAYQEFIQSVDDDCSLHDSFVTVDETWCFQYDHQRKRQRME